MGFGFTNHLLAVGGVVLATCFLLAWRRLPASLALLIALVRVMVPVIYFAWYFDGQWTFTDDHVYFEHGEYLIDQGFTPAAIVTEQGRGTLYALTHGGQHILYSWWNLVTMWLLGTQYYVPVLINVVVTFVTANALGQLAAELRFSTTYQRALSIFYLLHWDTIAWSSIVNLKDPIVQMLTVAFFLCAIRAVRHRSLMSAALSLCIFFLFQSIRFYVPFLIGAAAIVWLFLQWQDVRKYPLLVMALIGGWWLLPSHAVYLLETLSPFSAGYGIARFTLTPQPWEVQSNYSFLMLPATLHWITILPAIAGGILLFRDSPAARWLLIFGALLITVCALENEIQGARQRSQLSFLFTWMQMHLVWRWSTASASVTSQRATTGVNQRLIPNAALATSHGWHSRTDHSPL